MALCVLDTNGYVELLRGGPRATAIRAAIGAARTNLVVLMPVVAELLQGARSLAEERGIVQRFVAVVPSVRRIAATPEVWAATGSRVAAMLRAGHDTQKLQRRSFYIDVHVAVLCRSLGIVLMTDDDDHNRIGAHVHHHVEPLPG